MTKAEDEARRRAERAQQVALWRYQLIREAADPELTTRQRGRLVRALADQAHEGPFGDPVTVSRGTLDRWIRAWRERGFEGLVPPTRKPTPRTPAEVLELAVALKKERPERTGAQIARILRSTLGWSPNERTLLRHFDGLELRRPEGSSPQAFGRFEADRPNEIWTGDALHGPKIGGRKTFLFAFIDDHSRAIVGHRWGYFEDTVRLAAALRPALAARGVPEAIYVDNGSAFVDAALKRAAAKLAIRIIHSAPGQPEGRGKIERFFRTVRQQFLVEIAADGQTSGTRVADTAQLNQLFTAWVESHYHQRVHSETRQAPLARWMTGAPFATPTPAQLREAFKWSEIRQVTKTATVRLFGNAYCVEPALVGRKVELVFDPFDLTVMEVRFNGESMGLAQPQDIGRHAHPKAKPETPADQPAAPTGIDYLRLLDDTHTASLAGRINYTALTSADASQDSDRQRDDEESDGKDQP
ncbi:DDE-type integrase/transposase/recombinase [Actinomadura rupiterrae]|uniref:DDE-type integrase/transposase/recombinase n=1 Tax=Actinomadura rupiterrae TaxID=559627 RepID=UPI0020A36259|nr:DDE-type integrase/transposase/recombinase [Actinomadura rupiterrae]MCP2337532.1 putative transposase [Actinomadura rupiterrae]MCP2343155.1 putative transposase [Actinomadura rupiterrae]